MIYLKDIILVIMCNSCVSVVDFVLFIKRNASCCWITYKCKPVVWLAIQLSDDRYCTSSVVLSIYIACQDLELSQDYCFLQRFFSNLFTWTYLSNLYSSFTVYILLFVIIYFILCLFFSCTYMTYSHSRKPAFWITVPMCR